MTPRSELSGITDNNISENDFVVSEAANIVKKDAEPQDFLKEHKILPCPPKDAQDLKNTHIDVASALWAKRDTQAVEGKFQAALTIFNDKNG